MGVHNNITSADATYENAYALWSDCASNNSKKNGKRLSLNLAGYRNFSVQTNDSDKLVLNQSIQSCPATEITQTIESNANWVKLN